MNKPHQEFIGYRRFWIDYMDWRWGLSLGVHWFKWRIDIHFLCWIISIGRVPVYSWDKGTRRIAVSDSFHKSWTNHQMEPMNRLRR